MTTDEKARQIGALMLELKAAESEASQCREKVHRLQEILQLAAFGTLSTGGKQGNESYLAISEGSGAARRITLPTTEDVLEAVTSLEKLTQTACWLKTRLEDLGFRQ